jgi:nucleoid-associated protein YgaU
MEVGMGVSPFGPAAGGVPFGLAATAGGPPFDPASLGARGVAEAVPNDRFDRVDPGETLWSIAQKWFQDGNWWRRIWYANRIVVPNPDFLQVGQRLLIPFGAFGYVIHSGDTLWDIADAAYRNGDLWTRIWDANRDLIPNPNLLTPGVSILIP